MKKSRFFLLLMYVCVCVCVPYAGLQAQVDINASLATPNATYLTLTDAFSAINNGTHQGNIIIAITANTNENTTSAILNASGGLSSYTNISLGVLGNGNFTISGNGNVPIIVLNGADNVVFEGNNVSNLKGLTIENTITNTNAYALQLINGVQNSIFQNITLKSAQTDDLGVISIFANSSENNENININNCNITKNSVANPRNGVFVGGLGTGKNTNNIIQNCEISDFFNAFASTNGVFLANNIGIFTIHQNLLFQTANLNFLVANDHRGIRVSAGEQINITKNTIGYANNAQTGFYTTRGLNINTRFFAIHLEQITNFNGIYSNITGNIIKNIDFETASISSNGGDYNYGLGLFCAIVVGFADLDYDFVLSDIFDVKIADNIIGGTVGNNFIKTRTAGSRGMTKAIYAYHNGITLVENNQIGGITALSSNVNIAPVITVLDFAGIGTKTIRNNTIGSRTTQHSIQCANANLTTTDASFIDGIYLYEASDKIIDNNFFGNWTSFGTRSIANSGATSSVMYAIGGKTTITNNTITHITSHNDGGAWTMDRSNFPHTEYFVTQATIIIARNNRNTHLIENNEISYIENKKNGTPLAVVGILISGGSFGTNSICRKNRIYNINSASFVSASRDLGIALDGEAGNWDISNNMITLGIEIVNKEHFIYGIYDSSNAQQNIFYNSIFLAGTHQLLPPLGQTVNSACIFTQPKTSATKIYNNLLYNARESTSVPVVANSGRHYCIYVFNNFLTFGGTIETDYNTIFAKNSVIGFGANVAQYQSIDYATLPAWRASNPLFDNYSWSETLLNCPNPTDLFVDILTGNLHINATNVSAWYVSGKGSGIISSLNNLSSFSIDFEGENRSTTAFTGTTDIGADEFSIDASANPPPFAIETGTIGAGQSTFYTWANKQITQINWKNGTFPASMQVQYFSGETPPTPAPIIQYADSYWHITPIASVLAGNYDIKLDFGEHETGIISAPNMNAIMGKTDALAATSSPTSAPWLLYEEGVGAEKSQRNYVNLQKTMFVENLSSFSDFTLTIKIVPLPIKILNFSAKKQENNVILHWKTTQEKDFDYFLVEKSTQNNANNTFNFINIGRVNSVNNAQIINNYTFSDDLKAIENNTNTVENIYYRLKMVDKNGTFSYSDVRFVKINNNQNDPQNNVIIYPNPIQNDEINIYFYQNNTKIENINISITNILGQEIHQDNIKNTPKNININIKNWVKGIYFAKIKINNTLIIKKIEVK